MTDGSTDRGRTSCGVKAVCGTAARLVRRQAMTSAATRAMNATPTPASIGTMVLTLGALELLMAERTRVSRPSPVPDGLPGRH